MSAEKEDSLVDLARRILYGEDVEEDRVMYSIEGTGSEVEVLIWNDEDCGCCMGEAWAGDHLVTCGKCHGHGRPFLGGVKFKVEAEDVCTSLPKKEWA